MKKLNIDSANKIKCESVEEFENSIFSGVYQSATQVVKEIIEANNQYKQRSEYSIERFSNGNEISNVVSFLGERGMGKSSAMLSYAYYLKNLDGYKVNIPEKFNISPQNKNPEFYVLSKIDAAMIGKGENLLDIVLAKMWDEYNSRVNDININEYAVKDTKNKFSEVKKSYSEYQNLSDSSKVLASSSSLSELHALSRSLNLRKKLDELTECFLRAMQLDNSDKYLLICIDDLDIVKDDAYDILEQIRMFLTIPNVIIFITADIERLLFDISSLLKEKLTYLNSKSDGNINIVQKYARDYLAKTLPINMRIYMPYLISTDGELPICNDEILSLVYGETIENGVDENTFVRDVIIKYGNIVLYPQNIVYSTEYKSLRNIVNEIDEIENIIQIGEAEELIFQWMLKQVMIAYNSEDISERCKNAIKKLLKTDVGRINRNIINELNNISDIEDTIFGYEDAYYYVIEKISVLEDKEYIWMVEWIYSVLIRKMIYENRLNDIKEKIIKDNIFNMNPHNNSIGWRKEQSIVSILHMTLTYRENIFDFIKDSINALIVKYKLLLLFNIDDIIQLLEIEKIIVNSEEKQMEKESFGENTSKDTIEIRFKKIDGKLSLENFFENIVDYDKKWTEFVEKIINVITDYIRADKEINMSVDNLTAGQKKELNGNINIKDFEKWKKEYCVNNMYDLLPIQNVGVMIKLMKELQSSSFDIINNSSFMELLNTIIRVYSDVEKQYDINRLNYKQLMYSDKLRNLVEIMNIKDIPDVEFKKISGTGDGVPTTKI